MSKALKRLAAPTTWAIPRKTEKWVVKPSPGPHPVRRALPLGIVLRDILHYVDYMKEAEKILGQGKILVDKRKVINYKFPVGIFDVISIPDLNEHYRMLLDTRGKLRVIKIPADKSDWKLVRIENKTTNKKGKIQLNLHDGRNILVNENIYVTGDTLKIEVPTQKIVGHIPLTNGNIAYITGGSHIGELATIAGYEVTNSPKPNIVYLKEGFMTIKDYIFPVGVKAPEITLPVVVTE